MLMELIRFSIHIFPFSVKRDRKLNNNDYNPNLATPPFLLLMILSFTPAPRSVQRLREAPH